MAACDRVDVEKPNTPPKPPIMKEIPTDGRPERFLALVCYYCLTILDEDLEELRVFDRFHYFY